MTKKKAVAAKKLLPPKEVVVKSRAYGEHTRAARGTKTPVGLNKAFVKYNTRTVVVNNTAKRVHDFLKDCGKGFKEAMLWQAMLSRMRKAITDDVLLLLKSLEGLELNSRYPLWRFAHPFVSVQKGKKHEIIVTIRGGAPTLLKNGDAKYAYEIHLLVIGKKPEGDVVVKAMSEWQAVEDHVNDTVPFSFLLPKKMKYYVLCLHFIGGKKGNATGTMASLGMRVVRCGEVG